MAITFRDDIGPYTGKGSPLTRGEADGNIYEFLTRIIDLEALPLGVGIDDVTISGSTITFHLSDSTTRGPFPLPVAEFNPVGEWQPDTPYNYPDLVTVGSVGVYLVLQNHTSEAEFDGEAENTDGLFYKIMFPFPDVTALLRFRGDFADSTEYLTHDVIKTADHGVFVVLEDHISETPFDPDLGTTDGPFYFHLCGGDAPVSAPFATIATATYTLDPAHAGYFLEFTYEDTDGEGCVITVPEFADQPNLLNTEFHLRQAGGNLTIIEGGVASVEGITGRTLSTDTAGAVVTLKNVSTDGWRAFGLLAESTV